MESKEIYLFLDLNGKIDQNYFQKKNIHFKMINVNTDTPLVQIGNFVFQGSYEDFLGTKVFFVEDKTSKPSDTNVFTKEVPLHLKYIAKTAKVLQLKSRKVVNNGTPIHNNEENIDLEFEENYNAVLDKLEKGALDMKDIFHRKSSTEILVNTSALDHATASKTPKDDVTLTENIVMDTIDHDVKQNTDEIKTETSNLLNYENYKLLKKIAQAPMEQKKHLKMYATEREHLSAPRSPDNFPVLSQLFLQDVISKVAKSDDGEFSKYVNVNKSIEDGIIEIDADKSRLTDDQKCKLLKQNNFDNFTLPMKLAYLIEQLEEYKRVLKMQDSAELKVDEYGRTLRDKFALLKSVTKRVWYYVYSSPEQYA